MNKYFLNTDEKCIINLNTGEIMRPPCIDDLILYHRYLVGSGENEQAKHLLKDIFHGEQVISNMIAGMHQMHDIIKEQV